MIRIKSILIVIILHAISPIHIYAEDEKIPSKFGLSISNIGIQRSIISINSDKFLQREPEIYGRSGFGDGISLSLMYFLDKNNSITLRLHNLNNYNRTIREPIFSPIFGFGEYSGEYRIYRPDIELVFRNSPFGNSFYIGPVIGSTGPRNAKYLKLFQLGASEIEFPRGFSYNSSSRNYLGIDTGFMIELGDTFFLNIGYNIKLSSNPKTKQHLEINYLFLERYNFEDIVKDRFLVENLRRDLDTIKQGSQALYFEAGIKF